MLIKMLKARRRATPGQILEMTDGVANVLIRRKIAELYVPPPKEKPIPRRVRRSTSYA